MSKSKMLWNKRIDLLEKQKAFMEEGKTEDAIRIEGQITEIDAQIEDALNEEEIARNAAPVNIVSHKQSTFAEKLLGDKASFTGIEPGFKKSVPLKDAISGLETPQIYKTDLKNPTAPPTGFLATIQHGTTDGDEHYFLTPVLDNKAAGWTTGQKPESALEWEDAVSHLETVAHHMPIKKQTARRYKQLDTIVRNSLMLGLDLKADELSLRGNNSAGIVGVCEFEGILSHKRNEKKNMKDTINAMKRKVRVASGIAPNFVCLSPYALEELAEEKDTTGRYLFPDIEETGRISGLTIVEDVNMTTTDDKESILVYWSGAASWDIADDETVDVGLINSQFVENAYTLLAETTAALRVDTPRAICYCDDLGLEPEEDAVSYAAAKSAKPVAKAS